MKPADRLARVRRYLYAADLELEVAELAVGRDDARRMAAERAVLARAAQRVVHIQAGLLARGWGTFLALTRRPPA